MYRMAEGSAVLGFQTLNVNGPLFATLRVGGEEREKEAEAFIDVMAKEVESLLQNAGQSFGGSSKLTHAEVKIPRLLNHVEWKE
jgi:hypothetical protein